ncbi:MAG: phenylacetate-CoA oxygenase subunit PaaJ [Alphaproteobacteria bacterium]|uniref:1,2-phenylacetyl-CoA epoxidase subunit PaaD n=1 Tax=Ciceribacter selenitireducens TaxID=448181 RepID=UPI0004906628|nr:1,2-phenylacetyl-CoA epoxidase subunit PaaD [Ciceribacter selenitireducens]MBA3038506.1 phenylacetate-CoA oxygenase subunit PaaJ [Rhizobiaceae bacterium]MBU3962886.1 phenylacetate-CoA oxygenase subunit PaaJ [Alphaproteobacteria bacterium]PPJ48420.1 phenylacetate-CoA oxygenase subunit PaaJ [Rhizobium sp. KAs_5_22]MBU4051475.1 phenylacetate-CoA oxygenase subunit PaaJ [Alphaproteobacteria bacterium]MBU4087933.1 phenylacetate-CoA oxygenase subunit PaaJ [Alphaproteobacteria bacterium]
MDARTLPEPEEVWRWLGEVPDPEIPVISLTDLGIIRDVAWDGDTLVVAVTPTYSGCPATTVINLDIESALKARGIDKLRLERRLSPAWTSDWISAEGRDKLRAYGIAPPIDGTAADGRLMARANRLAGSNLAVACPRCGSTRTEKVSQFGSTPCKASYRCCDCLEPFDYFKCI